ncbi:aldo/keto reductase [Planktothrix agardhii CCAP 1459/11A]|jgi:predicted aldo/keto reductase-like oxidoreductase|uniref:Aldo/keto reductase n=1 Tax=Planktothrix agardhii CCAP 1459/11A TaxID=282420 RepID=A0A4P5ZQI2_PLAAG|nr:MULTISPECIES: aldo/keto reductase [Planktothrix]GDZ95622.1 aldo/keto reductase [Planktothrix agardhii CCAP 1459/11A]CAD0220601.1 Aldo/keto reductase [Planktothrix agardhii]CAD5970468.1 L-galactose dehydrogenase [Planktothrix agardhii]CAH2571240.1 L-galactose dehydrogenase [Planktothrix rubescens]
MRYRRFGKTNLDFSVFSLGTMRYLASSENAYLTIKKAISLGINHIETAQGYGESESFLGAAILGGLSIERSQFYITTKITPDSNPDVLEKKIDQSLKRLNLDYLDCLAIHGINTREHLEQTLQGLSGVEKAIADGRVHHLGFSTHAPLEVILSAIQTDLFQFVNLHYYYFFQKNAIAIELAAQKDMGIFIISPADKGGQLYSPPETLKNLCDPISPLILNYRFLLNDSRITTLSVGATTPEELELDHPLKVADQEIELTPEEIAIFQQLETQKIERLGITKCSQCDQCLPCPEQINIPEVLRLRNLALAYDMIEFGKYRYQMFENAGHWFPGNKANRCNDCGDCLPRCPEQLDIPTLLRETHELLKGKERKRLWE